LFPNVGKLGYNYPVIAVDTPNPNTITAKGDATAYLYPPTTFAVMYGQYIKDYIDASVVWGVVNIDIGNGADGPITINSVKNINTDIIAGGRSYPDGVNWQITNSVFSGQTTISSGIARPNGFAVGDEIIIINLKGTASTYSGVGLYEFKTITALPNSTSMTIDSNLNNYYDGTTQKIMVQRVPNYTDVTINTGGSLTSSAFDGNKGGVVIFRANGTVTINADNGITVSNKGFRGGIGGGNGGETYNGVGTIGGGGGGGSNTSLYVYCYGYADAVGGAGGNGGYGGAGSGSSHGNSYGVTDLTLKLFLGSGGGGGGNASISCFDDGSASAAGGNGGSAGGIIYVSANTFTVNSGSAVSSSGSNGTSGTTNIGPHAHAYGGNGGSGTGGSIAVYAGQINDSGSISANGGSGAGGGRTYAAYSSFSGNNPTPNYSSSAGRIITPGSAPFTVQVKSLDQTGTNSFADGYSTYTLADGYTTYNGICELCHSMTNHFRNVAGAGAPDQNHTNLSFLGSGSIPGTNCITCHSHNGGFKATVGCLNCHSMVINSRAEISSQFSGNSHHVQGVTVTGVDCYQCHWEALSDGTMNSLYHGGTSGSAVDLVIYASGGAYQIGTRPTTYTAGTTAIQYTANGTRSEIKKINSHCLGCHSEGNSGTVPFGDGKHPVQYAWNGRSIDERYSQTGTTAWGKYSGGNFTPKNTRTKAYSAHGNAVNNQGGWDLNETWPNTRSGSENLICLDCHNSHGSSVSGTTTSYTSATTNGGILKDIVAGQGGYTITYKPQAGGSTTNHNAYNTGAGLCFDCHLTATSGTTPWGYNSTFGATQDIRGYRDTPYFGPATSNPQQRFSYKLSNAIKGGHLGASSALSSTPTGTINGLCTPCHDPHGVSPTLGSNMQYGVPLLKGTWLTSLYKEDRAPANDIIGTIRTDKNREGIHYNIDQNTFGSDIKSSVTGITQTDTQFAGLCLNCHSKSSLTNGTNHTWKSKDRVHESVKGWKTTPGHAVQHNYPCSKCHIPHNAGLPRLMITNCLESRHKGFRMNNTAPRIAGSGSGYDHVTGSNAVYCGTQSCVTWPGSGDINCSTELGFCPPWYFTYGCGNGNYTGGGSGRTPGYYFGGCNPAHDNPRYFDHSVTCHENYDSNQYWNLKTPWSSVTSFTPPLIDEPNIIGTVPLSVTLNWNAVTSPDGDPVQYYVQVDNASDFSSPNYTSGWISGTSWSVTLPTAGTWYWRVQARDANHTAVVSEWSISDSFSISQTPPAPILIPEPDTDYPTTYLLQWYDVTGGTGLGDPVQYYVQMDDASNFSSPNYTSGWISETSWSITPIISVQTWYWRVQARNANHTSAVSPWSTVDSFITY
jgi:hypothetical protein